LDCYEITDNEYRILYGVAMRVALSLSLNIQQAEDVAQSVILEFWVRISSPHDQPIQNRKKWVTVCAYHAALRTLKSQQREVPLSHLMTQPGKPHNSLDIKIDFVSAIGRLSRDERRLLKLRYIERLRMPEIAKEIGCSKSTAQRRIRRVRMKIARALAYPCSEIWR